MPRFNATNSGSALHAFSFQLCRIGSTSVRVHWFYLLGLSFLITFFDKPPTWMPYFVGTIVAIIAVHDLVRIAVAKHFKATTTEVILLPSGGLTFFSESPDRQAEVAINACGILSFGVIAVIFGAISHLRHEPPLSLSSVTFLQSIFVCSFGLGLLNICPVFPLDGGFLLRAALNSPLSWRRATSVVGKISQLFALGLVIAGFITGQLILLLPAMYIYSSSAHLMRAAGAATLLKGKTVQEAMQVRFSTLDSGASLEAAAQEMREGSQHDFPIVVGEEIIGILTRVDLARGMARFGPSGYVAGQMKREFNRVLPETDLEEAASLLENSESPLLVMDGESLVGLLSRDKLNEYMMVVHARWLASRRERPS